MKNTIHPVQSNILISLMQKKDARFSSLNNFGLTTDHFNYHLQKLVFEGYVLRDGDRYVVSRSGKELANRIDKGNRVLSKSQMIVAIIVCEKEIHGKKYYLFQKREKQPFMGLYDFVSGKISWGCEIIPSAKRILKKKTGLDAELVIKGIQHKFDYSKDGNLLEDKYMFILHSTSVKGNLNQEFESGNSAWLTESELLGKKPTFKNIQLFLDIAKSNAIIVNEAEYFDKEETY